MKPLAYIGDVHLDQDEAEVGEFVAFLEGLGERCSRIVLMGDLFNLWVGGTGLEREHHLRVAETLRALRQRGVSVAYVEGNRDYRIADLHLGTTFDACTDRGIQDRFAGHRIFAIHGDLANENDRQYRTWRRVSRSWPFWAVFRLIPRGRRVALAERMESRMRGTNLDFKQRLPDDEIRSYAGRYLEAGNDIVVLGHFHVERTISAPGGTVYILPEWKGSRRYLELGSDGSVGFVGA